MKQNSLLIHNARIVLPERVINKSALLVEDGRITRIAASTREFRGQDSDLNLNGYTLFPGFIDVHIHGAVGVDTMGATGDDLSRISQFLASQGVTAWLPTLVPAPPNDYGNAVRSVDELFNESRHAGRPSGSRVLGVHYEGPFVNIGQCGALRSKFFRTFSGAEDLDALPTPKDSNALQMMTVAPEVEGGVELVRELTSRGWLVSIGHTGATIADLDRAYEAGARHMTHFMNAMAPLHHRSPGPVAWGLSRDDVTCDVIADGIHLDRFMLRLLLKLKGTDRLALISDAIAAAGIGDGQYRIWGETISVEKGRTRNTRGSIAGSVITMLDAVRMMLSIGASEVDVARMAATNPARLLRIDSECGSIEEGKRADLVALDGEGKVQLTIIGGRVAYEA